MEGNAQGEMGRPLVTPGEGEGLLQQSVEAERTDDKSADSGESRMEMVERRAEAGALDLEKREEERSLGERVMISSGQLGRSDVKNTELGVIEDTPQGISWGERAQESSEALRQAVAVENYGKKNVDPGVSLVGTASKKEIKEREKDDAEDESIEEGSGWNHDIMTASAERLTWSAVAEVDKTIKKKATKPRKLERERHLGMVALLKGAYQRIFGSRN